MGTRGAVVIAPPPAEIWFRLEDAPLQLSALEEARTPFSSGADFRAHFWSADPVEVNIAHEVEAGFTTVQNYAAEIARWAVVEAAWRQPSGNGYVSYNSKKDYELLRDQSVITPTQFGALWSLQSERNRLTHNRPEVDPLKVWVASKRAQAEVPAFFLAIQMWAPQIGIIF